MTLRDFRLSDAAGLVAVWAESFASIGLPIPAGTEIALAERLDLELSNARWQITIAERDGKLSGFMALAVSENCLSQLFIHPEAQGTGIGTALLDVAKQRMPAGFWLKTHAANGIARRFYEKHGLKLDRIELEQGGERAFYAYDAPLG